MNSFILDSKAMHLILVKDYPREAHRSLSSTVSYSKRKVQSREKKYDCIDLTDRR